MTRKIILIINFLVLFNIGFSLYAQYQVDGEDNKENDLQIGKDIFKLTETAPVWLLVEYAKKEREDKRFHNSLIFLLEADKRESNNADILYETGVTYQYLGEYEFAIDYLKRSIKNIDSSSVIKHKAYYKMAEINHTIKNYGEYEKNLLAIINSDKTFTNQNSSNLLLKGNDRGIGGNYLKILTGNGNFSSIDAIALDQLIYMYRVEDSYSQNASFLLGKHYFETRLYTNSLLHLSYSILKVYTRIINDYINNIDFNYEFKSSMDLFEKIMSKDKYKTYIQETNLAESLNTIALAIIGIEEGDPKQINIARQIWKITSTFNLNSKMQKEARYLLTLSDNQVVAYINSLQNKSMFKYQY